jgi:ubiquinol-cytochrome c reductase cytochrome b subunit
VLLVGGGNDLWATHFNLSINAITWFVRIGMFVVPVLVFIATKRICLGLQRRDKEKVLHGRETGIIKRLPHGEFIEVHEPLSQEQLHTLTAHEQYKPAEIGPTVDENGVERKVKGSEKLRAKLSQAYYGEGNQIEKPTLEEFKEIEAGHGHH